MMRAFAPSVNGLRLSDKARLSNQTYVTVYGIDIPDRKPLVKVVTMKTVQNGLIDYENKERITGVNSEKLDNNIIRARNKIFEYAYCNQWDFFFTATLNPKKYDRTDLEKFRKDFSQWIRDESKKYGVEIKYLMIPELHSDGESWHMHGFIKGLPVVHLKQFKVGDRMGKSLAQKVIQGEVLYNWEDYQKKFGFCDLEPIKNPEAVSKYVTKYVTKSLVNSVKELNAHLYYASKGLRTSEDIIKGTVRSDITAVPVSTYESEYSVVSWYAYEDLDSVLCAIES